MNVQMEELSKYVYGYCTNIEETLTIIRNAFSHIGRIYIGKDSGFETYIVLNDYDTDYKKSGKVVCKYADLIRFLGVPYISIYKEDKKK